MSARELPVSASMKTRSSRVSALALMVCGEQWLKVRYCQCIYIEITRVNKMRDLDGEDERKCRVNFLTSSAESERPFFAGNFTTIISSAITKILCRKGPRRGANCRS